MSSRRSQLFTSLRLFFWADVVLFVVLVSWFVYLRYQRSKLLDVVERQLAFNLRLSSDLAYANDILTNKYFNVASDFVSNIVCNVVSSSLSPSFFSAASVAPVSGSSDDQKDIDLPPLTFSNYFEVNGVSYIRLRNMNLKRGDFVLGYPIEDISPDVVQYRGKFFKVEDVKQ